MDARPAAFTSPDHTADGQPRARVALRALETLWFNTGTLCNIACAHCYIESSPRNDHLVYLGLADVRPFLDEIRTHDWPTREIGFTGGEPFMNPDMAAMAGLCLDRGFEVLILTNAMQPMQRPRVRQDLLALKERHGARLRLRISIDHFTARLHDEERGAGGFARTVEGLAWLAANGFALSIAGRLRWGDEEPDLRRGYAGLFRDIGVPIDADDPHALVLFPEMDETAPVPEITAACWGILGVSPDAMMCATSRMVVKGKGAARAAVLPCTLLPYEPAFRMGATLAEAARADGGNFERGAVKLNHPHCARFCVLGGGSCSQ
jgi:hypothetical protein